MNTFLTMAAGYFLLLPLVILATNKVRAVIEPVEIPPQDFPASIAAVFETQARALEQIGYQRMAYFRIPTTASGVSARIESYCVMMLNRATGDRAMIAAVANVVSGTANVTTQYVELSTRYSNGRMFDTLNASSLPGFAANPLETKTRVPSVTDPRVLHSLHRFVIARDAITARPVTYDQSTVAEHLKAEHMDSLMEQVRAGRFYLNKARDTFRPTLKGAYLMSWGQMWPITLFRRSAMERRARKTLREFHAVHPPLPPPLPA